MFCLQQWLESNIYLYIIIIIEDPLAFLYQVSCNPPYSTYSTLVDSYILICILIPCWKLVPFLNTCLLADVQKMYTALLNLYLRRWVLSLTSCFKLDIPTILSHCHPLNPQYQHQKKLLVLPPSYLQDGTCCTVILIQICMWACHVLFKICFGHWRARVVLIWSTPNFPYK